MIIDYCCYLLEQQPERTFVREKTVLSRVWKSASAFPLKAKTISTIIQHPLLSLAPYSPSALFKEPLETVVQTVREEPLMHHSGKVLGTIFKNFVTGIIQCGIKYFKSKGGHVSSLQHKGQFGVGYVNGFILDLTEGMLP